MGAADGDIGVEFLDVGVGLGDDGDYWLWVEIRLSDENPMGVNTSSHWMKNLGSTLPTCATIAEALSTAEYLDPGDFMGVPVEQLTDPCFLEDIALDVSVP